MGKVTFHLGRVQTEAGEFFCAEPRRRIMAVSAPSQCKFFPSSASEPISADGGGGSAQSIAIGAAARTHKPTLSRVDFTPGRQLQQLVRCFDELEIESCPIQWAEFQQNRSSGADDQDNNEDDNGEFGV